MHHTILVAATPDEAGRDALMLGVELARPAGAQVVLAGVMPQSGGPSEADAYVLRTLRDQLGDLLAEAPTDVPISIEAIRAASVLGGLHDLAEEIHAGLLVFGPSHRGVLERALRGDLTADAVFTAPCGVAVATSGQAAQAPRRIGVAWNETPEADEALEWAVQLAERTGGSVEIIRVLGQIRLEGINTDPEAQTRLEVLRQAAQQRASASVNVGWGDPGAVLTEITRDLDLLVLGSRARGPVSRTMLGSVSTEVLHGAHCPVVVLPRGVHAPLDTAAV